jgi:hypothetical protein
MEKSRRTRNLPKLMFGAFVLNMNPENKALLTQSHRSRLQNVMA